METINVNGVEYAPADAVRNAIKALEDATGIPMVPEAMTLKDFAEATGVLPGTVRTVCADSRVPAVKIGRSWIVRAREALGLPPLQINVIVKGE